MSLSVSFEFFPPRTPAMEETLWTSIEQLAPLQPSYVSVTYGAGGTTRERTHATIKRLLEETTLAPAAHLTCVGAVRGEIDEIVETYKQLGVRRIVALRGDPPTGVGTRYEATPGGYEGSPELVAGIREIGGIDVSVAAYPEKHPESQSWDADIDLLKRKIDAGADEAITQFFLSNDFFEAFVERVRAAGITVPIVPGLLPIHNFEQMVKFAEKTGTSVPKAIFARFAEVGDDPEARQELAAELAVEQVRGLIDLGFERIHFCTLNRARLVLSIFDALGLTPGAAKESVPSAKETAR